MCIFPNGISDMRNVNSPIQVDVSNSYDDRYYTMREITLLKNMNMFKKIEMKINRTHICKCNIAIHEYVKCT